MAEKKVDIKGMSKEKKREYIWDYYRYHIIFGCIGVLLAGSFLYEQVTKLDYVYTIALLSESIVSETNHDEFESELKSIVIPDGDDKEVATLSVFPVEDVVNSSDQMSRMYLQKLMVQLTTKEIDLMMLSAKDFTHYQEQELFSMLDETKLQIDSSNFVTTSQGAVVGISLSHSPRMEALGVDTSDLIVALPNMTKMPEASYEAINWLFTN